METQQHTFWRITCMAVLCMAMLFQGCARSTPEEALRAQLQHMQKAATAREPRAFMQGVAEDFSGPGGMDRAALHNLIRMQFLANANIGATTGPLSIELHDDKATVQFSVVLTGGNGRVLPDRVQSHQVTSGWRMEDGQWQVYYAQWQ